MIRFAQKIAKSISETVSTHVERTLTADICVLQISIAVKIIVRKEHVTITAASIKALEFLGESDYCSKIYFFRRCSYMIKYYDAKLCSSICSDECFLCYDGVIGDYECYTASLNDVTCDCNRTQC